jgi:hypothetical protein
MEHLFGCNPCRGVAVIHEKASNKIEAHHVYNRMLGTRSRMRVVCGSHWKRRRPKIPSSQSEGLEEDGRKERVGNSGVGTDRRLVPRGMLYAAERPAKRNDFLMGALISC